MASSGGVGAKQCICDAHHKLSKTEAQMVEAEVQVAKTTQASMEAYKATKKCHNDQMQYTATTYLINKNEVRSKVAIRFLGLDLMFLNMASKK